MSKLPHCSRAVGTGQASQTMAWPVLVAHFLKSSSQWTEKCYTFISIFVLVTLFLIYLTAIHNMGLEKFWLTQGLPLLYNILLDHDVFDYWISWPSKLLGYFRIIVWHEHDVYYCSYLSSSYLIHYQSPIMVKSPSSQETFVSGMRWWP